MAMHLRTATESDSDRIKTFFESRPLPGAIDVAVQRTASFFDQYRLFSDDYRTLLLEDEANEIVGLASLVFREGLVLGEKQTWGFATDLRIAPTRKAIAQWAQVFLPELERECSERRCRYVFSCVEHNDNQAYNALIRPTSHGRRKLPRYLLANRFRLIAVHGRIPFSKRPLSSIKLKVLEASDIEPLCAYLTEQARNRPLASIHTPERLMQDLARWPGLTLAHFRVARDSSGRIRGCAALWNGRKVQSLVPQTYHGFANTLQQSLWLASYAGLVRPFARPGEPMPIRYLTHLACDNAEVMHSLVDDGFSRLQPGELLSYVHFRGNWRTLPPTSFIASSLPFGLYLMLPPNTESPPWPGVNVHAMPPEFEPAWL